MILNLVAWAFAILAALLFFTGVAGFICPSWFKRPDEDKPPSRLKFLLGAWLAPLFPGSIAIVIWLIEAGV